LIRALEFAASYVYSPGGVCAMSERSRLLRKLLKAGDQDLILKCAWRVHQQAAELPLFAGLFTPRDVLIPVPKSAPHAPGSMWVAEHLATALVREGLARCAWTGLHRVRAVRKSATSIAGRRPSVLSHYDSFAMDDCIEATGRIILVDDIVSKGRTLLAAASRVQESLPSAQVRAFAMVRTMGLVPDVAHLVDPCRGEIRWKAGDAHRSP
jgi:predicted amidophosphoribosyltransferase